jgi:hypothetical protein
MAGHDTHLPAFAAGLETATGVDGAELALEAARYATPAGGYVARASIAFRALLRTAGDTTATAEQDFAIARLAYAALGELAEKHHLSVELSFAPIGEV